MIPGIERRRIPEWLSGLTNLDHFAIRQVLTNSLYYPACGRDGDPVRYLAGFVHSFVYVDYGLPHDDVWASLLDERRGFKGYGLLGIRDIREQELPVRGWHPRLVDRDRDGYPLRHRDYIKEPYAIWAVFDRSPEYDEEHGPARFSLLCVCADGVAAFQGLYHDNQCAPEVVAIIRPGTGYGCNWTDFRNPNKIFGRSVLRNPHGRPRYLLCYGRAPVDTEIWWPDYSTLIHHWSTIDGELGFWSA